MISIDSSYWKHLSKYQEISIPDIISNDIILDFLKQSKVLTNKYDILILVGKVPYISDEKQRLYLNKIITELETNFPNCRLAIKQHPTYKLPLSEEITRFADIIDSNIPGNLLSYVTKVTIAYASASLFEAKRGNSAACSLLHIFGAESEEHFKTLKNYISSNSSGEVSFPNSVDELVQFCKNIVGKTGD